MDGYAADVLEQAIDELRTELAAGQPPDEADDVVSFVDACVRVSRAERDALGIPAAVELGDTYGMGEFSEAEKAVIRQVHGEGMDLLVGLTATKATALQNWLADVFRSAGNKPFTLRPTPVPDVPPHLEDVAVERAARMVEAEGLGMQETRDLVAEMRQIVNEFVEARAAEAARRMEDKLHDRLVEAGWARRFDKFAVDLSLYPGAILTGPVIETRRRVRWRGTEAVEAEVAEMGLRRVHPLDFFPAPGAEAIEDAPWVVELRRLSRSELFAARDMPGFDAAAIERLLASHSSYSDRECRSSGPSGADDDAALGFDVRVFTGEMPRRLLADVLGLAAMVPGDEAALGYEFVEVWVCGGEVLRLVRDPWPAKRLPYYMAGFRPRPGTVWFKGLPEVLRDLQKAANATMRGLVKNVTMSSGPLIEMDVDSLANEDEPDQVEPWRVYKVEANAIRGSAPAVRVSTIPSVANHLHVVLDKFSVQADSDSGIPAYVAGDPNVAGAGRTLGGLAMLMGNAAKGVKRVVGHIDRGVIMPLIGMLYDMEMLYGEDPSVKADARVEALGAAGLLQRELTQGRAVELLQLILNPAIVQSGVVPESAVPALLREVAAGLGYDPDIVAANPDLQQSLVASLQATGVQVMAASGAGGGAAGPLPTQPAPGGVTDGRSVPQVGGGDAGQLAQEGIDAAGGA